MGTVVFALIVGLVLLIVIIIGSGRVSMNRFMIRRQVSDAVSKAKPGASISDVEVGSPGDLRVTVEERGERCQLRVSSWGPFTIAVAHDPSSHVPQSGTYGFLDKMNQPRKAASPELATDVRQRVETAINTFLPSRGFSLAEHGSPDILVAYEAATDGPLNEVEIRESYGYHAASDWVTKAVPGSAEMTHPVYEKGSLIIDVLEPSTRRLLWRGAVVADIVVDVPEDERYQRVRKAVELVLSRFPPPVEERGSIHTRLS